jgi:hypothetical protein
MGLLDGALAKDASRVAKAVEPEGFEDTKVCMDMIRHALSLMSHHD